MEKYITFSVSIKKEVNNDDGNHDKKKRKQLHANLNLLIVRFMPTLLSELADDTFGLFNSIECKSCIEKININSECCFVGLINNKLIYKC